MLRRFHLYISFIPVFWMMWTCQPDREVDRVYPVVTTQVTDITQSSVMLEAGITGNLSGILEYGFVWSVSTVLDLNNGSHEVISGEPDQPWFSHNTGTVLAAGTLYYARAFVRTSELIIYGNMISFTTLPGNPSE